ncbi:DUF4430 domain-containing protein [Oceanobacillus profundus]|uniref:DUF4430 domain-containing protein n=2 Tax=Bacillaceae TaxID=186817 RepID=A0A417YG72_9BACI|nr:DUF4430 domain-containing protein [Oceanobacillus sp.]PAE29853.1 hypothetical protein CHI07_07070 [Paenibacillus sp. 7884-2]RHW31720.1 DUF4430 domain-containing protein [Oceanobacillus profundus]
MSVGLLFGCSSDENTNQNTSVSTNNSSQSEEVAEDSVRITISINEGEEYVTEEVIQIEEGDILMDVMEENFYIETAHDGQYITSIERVAASDEEKTAWMFFVNDEMATVGASDYELSPGDVVVFDLQPWE